MVQGAKHRATLWMPWSGHWDSAQSRGRSLVTLCCPGGLPGGGPCSPTFLLAWERAQAAPPAQVVPPGGAGGGQMTDQAQVSERPAEREGAGCSLGPDCRHAAGTRVLDGRGLGTGLRGLGTGQAGQEPPLGRTLRPVAPARAESPARLCPGRQQVKRQQPAGEVGGHCSRTHLLLGRPGGPLRPVR